MLDAMKDDIDHRDFIPIDASFDSKTKTLKSTIDKVMDYKARAGEPNCFSVGMRASPLDSRKRK